MLRAIVLTCILSLAVVTANAASASQGSVCSLQVEKPQTFFVKDNWVQSRKTFNTQYLQKLAPASKSKRFKLGSDLQGLADLQAGHGEIYNNFNPPKKQKTENPLNFSV